MEKNKIEISFKELFDYIRDKDFTIEYYKSKEKFYIEIFKEIKEYIEKYKTLQGDLDHDDTDFILSKIDEVI